MKKILSRAVLPAVMALVLIFACVSLSACSSSEEDDLAIHEVEITDIPSDKDIDDFALPFYLFYDEEQLEETYAESKNGDAHKAAVEDFIKYLKSGDYANLLEEGYYTFELKFDEEEIEPEKYTAPDKETLDLIKNESIYMSGSDSMSSIMSTIGQEYKKETGVNVTTYASNSISGIEDLYASNKEDRADLCMVSAVPGKLFDEYQSFEKNEGFGDAEGIEKINRYQTNYSNGKAHEIQIALDQIVLIVNDNCSIKNVTWDEINDLYMNGTPIQNKIEYAIFRETGAGICTAFNDFFDIEIRTDVSEDGKEFYYTYYYGDGFDPYDSSYSIIKAIDRNTDGDTIGYASYAAYMRATANK